MDLYSLHQWICHSLVYTDGENTILFKSSGGTNSYYQTEGAYIMGLKASVSMEW